MDIGDIGLSQEFISRFEKMGYTSFFPPQEDALKTGFLEGKNIVVAIPTASGKTLLAYLAIIRCIQRGKKAVYVVPLKALAEEKFRELKQIGLNVALSMGDYDSGGTWLRNFDVVVATSEKFDSLMRHEGHMFDDVFLFVVDEVHLLHSVNRGPTLEIVMVKMKHKQIVALSATISNASEIAEWLDAELVVSDWRPVTLKKGVFSESSITYDDNSLHAVKPLDDDAVSLVADGMCDGGQVLVFVNSRRSTQAVAKRIASYNKKQGVSCNVPLVSDSQLGDKLAECLNCGVAFHHAGMDREDRALVEELFKKGVIRAIVATPTLAAGINLPARRVVVRDWRRFDINLGNRPISNLEIQQMMGRAGRPRFDTYGEAILMAKSPSQCTMLFDAYINAPTERITSKLSSEDALRRHVLSLCNPETTSKDLYAFFEKTFYSHQFGTDTVMEKVALTLEFLKEHALVEGEEIVRSTLFGKRVNDLYIDPLSGICLKDALRENMQLLGMLHAICHTPDMPTFYLRKGEFEDYDFLVHEMKDDFLIEVPDSWYEPDKYEFFLSEVKTASVLLDWISEVPERNICEKYDIGPGDLIRIRENAEWISYAFKEIAKTFNYSYDDLHKMVFRIKNGVGPDLLELTLIKGIGRVRARKLYNLNIRTKGDIRKTPLGRLERILGRKTAVNIKKEVGIMVSEKDDLRAMRDSTLI